MATVAIGQDYYDNFITHCFPSWKAYCEKHDIGLFIITDYIDNGSHVRKKPTWHKLLVGKAAKALGITNAYIAYLDTDIIINPFAPNVFNYINPSSINVVSNTLDLPYESKLHSQKTISYYRHYKLDPQYPLDSSLYAHPHSLFNVNNLKHQNNAFCAGFFAFSSQKYSSYLEEFYNSVCNSSKNTLTSGGDNPFLIERFFNDDIVHFINYRYQALWMYEMSNYYPFLYKLKDIDIAIECILSSLERNYFLHFNGSLWEGQMWKLINEENFSKWYQDHSKFVDFSNTALLGRPAGRFKPSKINLLISN